MEKNETIYITIGGYGRIIGYGIIDEGKISKREEPSHLEAFGGFVSGDKISEEQVQNWLILNLQHFDNILEPSDMYSDIAEITEITVNYKVIPDSGQGFAILKNPEQHQNIYCPDVEGDCWFQCADEAGLKFKEGKNFAFSS